MGYYHTKNPENGINTKRHFCKFCRRRVYEKFLRLYEDGPFDVYVCRDRQACFKAQARRDSLNLNK